MAEVLQKSFDWTDLHPRAKVRPVPRFVLHVRCPRCGTGYYASAPMLLPAPCSECQCTALRPCCTWDLATSAVMTLIAAPTRVSVRVSMPLTIDEK